ncbi:protease inhibitor I42 family protein [Streptomyces sp. NPDC003077]|uniref:protease inhibitor I42 family protein n=1 Tax=Streptomyces sp. NPDC003077 TaxID=3154443 RepID=UPI0033BCAE09
MDVDLDDDGIRGTGRGRPGTDGSRPARAAGIVVAVAALVAAVFAILTLLSAPLVFGEGDTKITVSAGDRFSVQLAENPATGYRWVLADPRPDPAVLRSVGGHYDATERITADPGGTRYLDFVATGSGRTRIELRRCFRCGTEGADQRDAKRVTFRVVVE